MIQNKKILAIIPARSGSKGIKNKNLKKIQGNNTLFDICIKQAIKSKMLTKIIVSTDEKIILNKAGLYKKVNFIKRPKIYSRDNSSMYSVVLHTIDSLKKKKEKYDYIIILQVTCPFRTFNDIDNSIKELIRKKEADTLVSVTIMKDFHPARMYKKEGFYLKSLDKNQMCVNRQKLDKTYHRNGLIYLFKLDNLIKFNSFYGKKIIPFLIEQNRSLNIDNYNDLIYARAITKNKITIT
jgi:CMP-N-acetylneuraminic acid synthetase